MKTNTTGGDQVFLDALVLCVARVWLTFRHFERVVRFRTKLGYWPNLATPRTYNERMLWRKVFDHNPLFERLTDKLGGKDYLRAVAPHLPLPATLWVGTRADEIPDIYFSGGAIIKTNFWSGDSVVPAGGPLGRGKIVARFRRRLARRFGMGRGEWAYDGISRKIFAEQLLSLGGDGLPTDIKVHVFNGEVGHVFVQDTQRGLSATLDASGLLLPGRSNDYPREDQCLEVTERVSELGREAIALAVPIAGEIDHLRVDFLVTATGLFGGELTVYSGSGYSTCTNPAFRNRAEQLWDLRRSWFMRQRHSGMVALYVEALRRATYWNPQTNRP